MDADEIATEMILSMAQVHAALAYYHANKAEIESEIDEERALFQKHKQEQIEREA